MEFCTHCGELLPDHPTERCPKCGRLLSEPAQWNLPPQVAQPQQAVPIPQAAPQPGVSMPQAASTGAQQMPNHPQQPAPAPQAAPQTGVPMPQAAPAGAQQIPSQPQQAAPAPQAAPQQGMPIYAAGSAPQFGGQPPRAPEPPAYGMQPPALRYNSAPLPELSTAGYLGTLLLFAIPLVGLVLMVVWSFADGVKPERKKLARAYLIRSLILAGIGLLLALLLGVSVAALLAYDPYFFYSFYY